MKKTRIAGIMLIVTLVMAVVYAVVLGWLQGQRGERGVTVVESIQPLSAEVASPDERVFHKGALNPTVKVETGSRAGGQPGN